MKKTKLTPGQTRKLKDELKYLMLSMIGIILTIIFTLGITVWRNTDNWIWESMKIVFLAISIIMIIFGAGDFFRVREKKIRRRKSRN